MNLLRPIFRILAIYFLCVVTLGLAYAVIPPVSTLMLARWVSLQGVERDSVPLSAINRQLPRAVILAEDSRFCTHWGVDWRSMTQVIEKSGKNGPSRGASTLSMQVAKNLFLWPQRSYLRKALEIPIALYLDLIWSKSRMMEVYLSIAEWGPGIFGAEAAAQAYFHKPARKLNAWESSLLAAALPNPIRRRPDHPSPGHSKRAHKILVGLSHGVESSCIQRK